MKKVYILLIVLAVFTGTARAMDATEDAQAIANRAGSDLMKFLFADTSFQAFYNTKNAERKEYKISLLRQTFLRYIKQKSPVVPLPFLQYLCDQIDLVDTDKPVITFSEGYNTEILGTIIKHQAHDERGRFRDIGPLLEWCINRGAPVNCPDYITPPLAIAIAIANEDVVAFLLEKGADINTEINRTMFEELIPLLPPNPHQFVLVPSTIAEFAHYAESFSQPQIRAFRSNICEAITRQARLQAPSTDTLGDTSASGEISSISSTSSSASTSIIPPETTKSTPITTEKSRSLPSLKKFGIACAGTILTCLALRKIYTWLCPQDEEETEIQETTPDAIV